MITTRQELNKLIGVNIRHYRKKRGYTIGQLAAMAEMDYTQLSRIELGKISTSVYQLYRIAVALGVTPSSLWISTVNK
ncbi:MAG: helix-turn-helix transcriptional regulator [Chitinophagaceae bacterium]|nr:helix-turn-helix transcriptional regulator [Chitinophagaceae bacterium]